MPLNPASPAAFTIIDAIRYWRLASDQGQPVLPSMFSRLGMAGCGLLAPTLDALLRLFEAAHQRRFEAGAHTDTDLTHDESWLIEGIDHDDATLLVDERSGLVMALLTSLRSTRLMIGSVLLTTPASTSLSSSA